MTAKIEQSLCQKCIAHDGGCCTDVEITLHRDEAAAFLRAKVHGLPAGHSFEQDHAYEDLYEYNSHEKACMFLDEQKQCSIYDERPTICRTYPVMWAKRRRRMNYFVDITCPLTGEVAVTEFLDWMEHLPHPEIIRKIGELDFNTRGKDYINLSVIASRVTNPAVNLPSIRKR